MLSFICNIIKVNLYIFMISLRTYIEENPLIVAHHLIIGVFLIPLMSLHYPIHEPGKKITFIHLILIILILIYTFLNYFILQKRNDLVLFCR